MKHKETFIVVLIICAIFVLCTTNVQAKTYTDLYTNYRFVGGVYDEYVINTYYRSPIDDSLYLGTIEDYGSSNETIEVVIKEEGPWGMAKKYDHYPKYTYCYTYLASINAPYQDESAGQYTINENNISSGVYPSYELEISEIKSSTFEAKVE